MLIIAKEHRAGRRISIYFSDARDYHKGLADLFQELRVATGAMHLEADADRGLGW